MALILLVKVQPRVFTAKCSETQVGISNGMIYKDVWLNIIQTARGLEKYLTVEIMHSFCNEKLCIIFVVHF